ncbi:unnamed protein product [Phytophthora fragariaefolia]|uniref:Unnamed protein product n=1 Tax=Phytophthora fragariaefolia TaxID=1490495 RepID=A0A9W6XQY8_9STRA|nr:unnamed protein product [Phytophthora fragariaefolia]
MIAPLDFRNGRQLEFASSNSTLELSHFKPRRWQERAGDWRELTEKRCQGHPEARNWVLAPSTHTSFRLRPDSWVASTVDDLQLTGLPTGSVKSVARSSAGSATAFGATSSLLDLLPTTDTMPTPVAISKFLPALLIPEADQALLQELATTLVTHNLDQYNNLCVNKDGHPDNRLWVLTQKVEGIRIYRERPRSVGETPPAIPSLLLLGSVVGNLSDVMYGVVAPTDETLKIKSSCIRDGVIDSKVLEELVSPTVEDPFHHVSIQWRLYEDRDYVTLDTSGIIKTPWGERVGYNVSHSVGFPQLPAFTDLGIARGNMSVCSLYRQKANHTVECYTRGFFDLSSGTHSNAILALQTIATQWQSFSRNMECAQMKKLAWRLRKNSDDADMVKISPNLVDLLPELSVSDADRGMLRDLASTLVAHNLEQRNMLLVTKKGHPDSSTGQWKEMRRKDGLRIYRECPSRARGAAPFTPSLLLLGTVDGTVEDVMYGVVAPTDAALRIKSSCVNDGMLDTKMLCELVESSVEDPFRHVGIKWKLYQGRDYVSLDATGVVHLSKHERIGYNLAHSVAFSELPHFNKHGVLRGNMSVCSLYKQKTPTTVECYVRGFFDFPTENEMLNNVALQTLASQWLSFGRKVECGRMKKLIWKLHRNRMDGRSLDSSSSSSSTCSSSSYGSSPNSRLVCTRCIVKKIVRIMAADGRTVLEKKHPFCRGCIDNTLRSDTLMIAREELTYERENEGEEDLKQIPELLETFNIGHANNSIPIPGRAKSY